jgi:hypothetical protein
MPEKAAIAIAMAAFFIAALLLGVFASALMNVR